MLSEPAQQRIRPGSVARGAPHIETGADRDVGVLMHAIRESSVVSSHSSDVADAIERLTDDKSKRKAAEDVLSHTRRIIFP